MAGNDSNTKFLLQSNTTNGSTTFTDSSTEGHVITSNGEVQHSTTQKKFGTSSIYFDGSGNDFLNALDSADWDFGTGEFTVDMWVRPSWEPSAPANRMIPLSVGSTFLLHWNEEPKTYVAVNGLWSWSFSGIPSMNVWTHIAITRDAGSTMRVFFDGIVQATFASMTENITGSNSLNIGKDNSGQNQPFGGYIDEVRISDIARWTSNFTPPTFAYTSVINKPTIHEFN